MTYTSTRGRVAVPKPDFYLPEYDLYIEHWAIDERGNVPAWFGENAKERYRYGMNRKRDAMMANVRGLLNV
jgi:DNA helicase-4